MAQLKQTVTVTNGSQTVTVIGTNVAYRIKKNAMFMVSPDLVPYTVAADSTFDGTNTVVSLTGAYQGTTAPMASGIFATDFTVPHNLPLISQGDVGTAAIWTAAMNAIQNLITNTGTAAPTVSPAFTGTPTAPTAAQTVNNTQIATTAFVKTAIAAAVSALTVSSISGAAPLASPALTGVPTAPTAVAGTNTTQIATTAFVKAAVAAGGGGGAVSSVAGRTGAVTLTNADVSGSAPLASPALTGTPTAPTATAGTNTTQLATTAFVAAAVAAGGGTSTDTNLRFVESFTAGGTDNTTQIKNALLWLQGATNRTLAFAHNKIYTVSSQCNLAGAKFFRIEGNGATIKGAAGMSVDYGWLLLNMTTCTDGVVIDLNFDGNRSGRPVAVGKEEAHNVQIWNGCQRLTFVRVQSNNACCDGFYLGADDVTAQATFPTDIRFDDCQANNGWRNNMSLINTVRFRDFGGIYNNANGTAPQDGIDLEPNGAQADGNLGNIDAEFHGTTCDNNVGLGFSLYLDSNTGIKFYDITAKANASGAFGSVGGDFEIRGFTVEDHGSDVDRGVIDLGETTHDAVISGVVSINNNTGDATHPLIYVDPGVTGVVTIDGVKHIDSDCVAVITEFPIVMQDIEAHNQSGDYVVKILAGADRSVLKNVQGYLVQAGVYVDAADVSVAGVRLDSPAANGPLMVFDGGALRPSLDGCEVFQDGSIPSGQVVASFANVPARVTNVIGLSSGTAWTEAELLDFGSGTTGAYLAGNSPSSLNAGGSGGGTVDLSGYALLASPTFTGVPKAPTAAPGTNTTQIATTAWVNTAIAGVTGGSGAVSSVAGRVGAVVLTNADISGSAPLASPALTGTPTAPTATAGTNTTQLATTAFVTTAVSGVSGGSGAPATVKASALNNFKKTNTQKLAAIIARGAAGRLRGRITIIGDSYSAGYGAGDGDNMIGGRAKCYSSALTTLLAARGVAARADWTVGTGFTDTLAELATYDPRLVLAGCQILTDYNAIGGNMIQLATSSDKMTFTPGLAFNTVEILVACNNQAGVSGNFDVLLNGSNTVFSTVTSNDLMGMKKVTLTVTTGSTSVALRGKTNSSFIAGIGTRNTAAPCIEVINGAATGQTVNVLAAAPTTTGDVNTWNNRAASTVLLDTNALNVTLINGWYNDKGLPRTVAQMQTDLTALINFYKTYGDVIFLGYVPLTASEITQVDFDTWQNAAFATCATLDIPYINPPAALGTNAVMLAQGFYGDAGLHCGSIGHAAVARLVLAGIDSVV